jgi:DNA (cytosine-5)-methyltransferase 1
VLALHYQGWEFEGSMNQIYKQIGNAVPVNLAYAIGQEIVKSLNNYSVEQELRSKYNSLNNTTVNCH